MKVRKKVEIHCVDGYTIEVKNPTIERLEEKMRDDRIHVLSVETTDRQIALIPKEKIIMMLVDGAE